MNKTALMVTAAVIMVLAGIYYFTLPGKTLPPLPSLSDSADKDTSTPGAPERNTPARTEEGTPVQTDNVRTVDVPIERTGATEQVVLNSYRDPNYPFTVTFPAGYSYEIRPSSVIFNSRERSMVFSAEVIFTMKNGGIFSSAEAVKEDYVNQLEEFGPSIISSQNLQLESGNILFFDVRYTIPGRGQYANGFAVGSDQDYFYVLQFMVPWQEYASEKVLIDSIVADFSFGAGKA